MKNQKFLSRLIILLGATGILIIGSCAKKAVRTDYKKTINSDDKTAAIPEKILNFTGKYSVDLPGYKGVLTLKYNGKLKKYTGEISFTGWGEGKAQPLKKLSIKGDKIYFERSIETAAELREFGGMRYFRQKYYGRFSRDRTEIKGEFHDSGAVYNWRARR
jgi:hypothetical protein